MKKIKGIGVTPTEEKVYCAINTYQPVTIDDLELICNDLERGVIASTVSRLRVVKSLVKMAKYGEYVTNTFIKSC